MSQQIDTGSWLYHVETEYIETNLMLSQVRYCNKHDHINSKLMVFKICVYMLLPYINAVLFHIQHKACHIIYSVDSEPYHIFGSMFCSAFKGHKGRIYIDQ